MNTISFPLTLNMVRPQVADLQEGLALLGYSIDEEERAKQRYGKSTRAAVLAFQTQQRLSANGEVNRSTAQRLNQLGAAVAGTRAVELAVRFLVGVRLLQRRQLILGQDHPAPPWPPALHHPSRTDP